MENQAGRIPSIQPFKEGGELPSTEHFQDGGQIPSTRAAQGGGQIPSTQHFQEDGQIPSTQQFQEGEQMSSTQHFQEGGQIPSAQQFQEGGHIPSAQSVPGGGQVPTQPAQDGEEIPFTEAIREGGRIPYTQPVGEFHDRPQVKRASTSSSLHHNRFKDSFLSRVHSFFQRDSHIGHVGRNPLRDNKNVEIHTWNGPNDPDNPFNWSKTYKWILTLTICFISILTGLPAGSYGAGNKYMAERFHVQNEPFPNLAWATTSWNMGAAFWPMIFVPLTESSGRMPGYFVAYFILVVSLFPSAFAPNFATLVVTRFFGGGASSVSINIVGGSISDVWYGDKARSLPMSLFGFTSVVGIALGPFIGSAILQIHRSSPWRWIFVIQIIYNAGLIPIFWLILRETRADVILKKRAKKLRLETGRPIYAEADLDTTSVMKLIQISFERPTRMLLTEPVVIFFTLWVSFAWGILFLFFSSVAQTFSANYGWSTFQTGLVQLAISCGAVVGTVLNPIQDWIYLRSARRNRERPGKPIPEARLYTSIPGSLLFAGGLFWYGWGSVGDGSISWIVPALGVGCTGVGIYSIYMAVVNYLTDAYEKYAASALSAASLGRNTFGAFLPLASYQLFQNLGYGWAGSLLGFIGLALSVVPVVLVLKGPAIRRRSPFMREAMFDPGSNSDQDRDSEKTEV